MLQHELFWKFQLCSNIRHVPLALPVPLQIPVRCEWDNFPQGARWRHLSLMILADPANILEFSELPRQTTKQMNPGKYTAK